MQLTDSDRAYLAGLFDGEGCVGYYERMTHNIPYHSASLHVCMTDPRPVQWLQAVTGLGKISVTYPKQKRPVFQWQLCKRKDIRQVLEAIRPFLKIKGDQADLLFALWEAEDKLPKGHNSVTAELLKFREEVARRIKALKTVPEKV